MSRSEKVAQEIKREVSVIVQEELHDPRLGFLTITRVDVTPDLRFARVFFSVYGDDETWKKTQAGLDHASGFIRRLIGERLGLRFVPEVAFRGDHSSEYSIVIEQEIDKIKQEQALRKAQKKKGSHGPSKTAKRIKKKRK
jgi:ribosome-binding factor A